jgi:hypothetical protein
MNKIGEEQSILISNRAVLKIAVEILRNEPSLELGFQDSCAVGVQVKAGSHCSREEGMGLLILEPLLIYEWM